jgi:aspartyl aminopeptidase
MAPPKSALQFLDFVNASPTRKSHIIPHISYPAKLTLAQAYHAVASAASLLEKAGFAKIRERDDWSGAVKPGGKYYLTRNGSSIVAFTVGHKWAPGGPVGIVGAHTDSPTLRLKPVSKKSGSGFMQVGVETYGGGIWHSWFDRDLSVAGRVLIKDDNGGFEQRLVKVDKPILRIPTLAIHLNRAAEFNPNKETELFPIVGLVAAELNRTGDETKKDDDTSDSKGDDESEFQPLKAMTERHHPPIVDLVAAQAGVSADSIVDFELVLYDVQKSCLGGLNDEFIFSARLDNLDMTFCSVAGLIASVSDSHASSLDSDASIRMIACFDHEEIGSTSAQGADSNLLPAVLRRLSVLGGSESETTTAFEQTLSRSFLVSADMAHSVHPNYAGKYESSHSPSMNAGVVIKVNANQRYATNSPGIVLVREAARLADPPVPLQLFVVRNDSPCGSTIGPMLSAKMGVRTLDLGNPQLSMHSIRETGGSADVAHGIGLFSSFFRNYGVLEGKILVD